MTNKTTSLIHQCLPSFVSLLLRTYSWQHLNIHHNQKKSWIIFTWHIDCWFTDFIFNSIFWPNLYMHINYNSTNRFNRCQVIAFHGISDSQFKGRKLKVISLQRMKQSDWPDVTSVVSGAGLRATSSASFSETVRILADN